MVDSDTIETKISDKKEEFDEKVEDKKDDFEEMKEEAKEKIEDKKEKSKNLADNVINDLYKSIDDFKENIKNMQKNADQRYQDYKKSTVQTLDIDLVETSDVYYIKAAVPGVSKEDILIEAGDNDITIETTFTPYIEEFDEEDEAEVIVSAIKSGRCVKTVRFENSIDIENITAKFKNGTVVITLPKLIIPKHKVNVE
ncbi:MAG: Hsp20/alpha crystallin family protein [Methanobrevibacter sp.]|uniref:Hsp20/alpha crystallin family protein n=1 Tax=Methanobrevibacter sp. TaxID=66852 RepID=UPI001DFD17F8|nr:Hsp20/alpha crystallin family protein [Methanobrevibacter sp.]MBE6490650.1 Hsp20/alpha crystallin family protein [Methanobrevibacter sp.]MEE0901172.1 Hsp20/alpha crystallin family protein [Methanobrevibacter sp.]MEE0934532.1 Hsp20/alpha crystallin family protein [Methanobrevibacter sp.]